MWLRSRPRISKGAKECGRQIPGLRKTLEFDERHDQGEKGKRGKKEKR